MTKSEREDGATFNVHPVAALFPMLDSGKLEDLAADIKANGLIHPIVTDASGTVLIDGRNRLAACELAGVEPRFERLNGEDPVAFIFSANLSRRDLTQNQKAIVLAKAKLTNCKFGEARGAARVAGIPETRISEALTVLRYAPGLADDVLAKKLRLDQAVIEARRLRAMGESNDEKWQRVRTEAPDLADAGISLDEALEKLEARKQEGARLAILDADAPDLAGLVRDGRIDVREGMRLSADRAEKRRTEREGATWLLAGIVKLMDFRGQTPVERAGKLMANFDPVFWDGEPLTPQRLKDCGAFLIECSVLLKGSP